MFRQRPECLGCFQRLGYLVQSFSNAACIYKGNHFVILTIKSVEAKQSSTNPVQNDWCAHFGDVPRNVLKRVMSHNRKYVLSQRPWLCCG